MNENENEIEYEEFTGLVRPEDIGSEVLISHEWRNILDVGKKFFITDYPSGGIGSWENVLERTIRRPKPKKKMVRFWRVKIDGNWFLSTKAYGSTLLFQDKEMGGDTCQCIEPFGEPFEE